MSVWSKLFGADEIIEKVASGVDYSVFTGQERAEHYINVLKNIEPFKIAQRWFALTVILAYVGVWVICAGLFVAGAFHDDPSWLISIAEKLADKNNENLSMPVMIIVGFYFGGGMAEGVISKLKGK